VVAEVETGAGEVGATEELGTAGALEATEEVVGTTATGVVEVVHSVVVVVVVYCIKNSSISVGSIDRVGSAGFGSLSRRMSKVNKPQTRVSARLSDLRDSL